MDHHVALAAGYGTAIVLVTVLARAFPGWWQARPTTFARPWREVGLALLACVVVAGIGQLFVRGYLLPERGASKDVLQSLNQVLIFAPVPLLLLLRRQGPETAWFPRDHLARRIVTGLGLALAALLMFQAVDRGDETLAAKLARTFAIENVDLAVQVFLEDLTIGVLFVRMAAALRRRWLVIVTVAALFAAGHIPAMLADGAATADLAPLLLDVGLGVAVLAALQRTGDLWWFWPVHFALDMSQFAP